MPQFDWHKETFAFSNDTVFDYGVDAAGQLTMHRKQKVPQFSHRCFVCCRAVLQFHKFARFDPALPRISDDAYRALIRHISRIPVWLPEKCKRIVIPGYANFHEFSTAKKLLLQENLGYWFPTYLRYGNWRMVGPFPRFGQANAAHQLERGLDRGKLQAVYITRFPRMNHCLILFNYHAQPNGDLSFDLYDPNYPNEVGTLDYRADQQSFEFPKRWFWTGGRVNLMRVYISPIH